MTRVWTINGRFLDQGLTGVQRYAREIVCGLDRLLIEGHPLCSDLEIELVMPPGASCDLDLTRIRPRTVGRLSGHLWEQLELPFAAGDRLLSLCNTGPVLASRHIVCIHDANTRIVPESYSFAFRLVYRVLHPVLGSSASRVTTVSKFSAEQIAKLGIAPKEKVDVIANGHEHALRWRPEFTDAIMPACNRQTIVVLGSRASHKNISMLLDLAPALAKEGLQLAIVGAANASVFSETGDLAEAENVLWLGRRSDSELAALYDSTLCLAFPSLTEGFGLPPLEAMALGCPVVSSDRASLPEVGGEAVLYADPLSPADWLDCFVRLRDDAVLRENCERLGHEQAAKFSWSQSAERYAMLFAQADGLAVSQTTANQLSSVWAA